MDDGFLPPPPESPEAYLDLIDASYKSVFRGSPFLCVNPERDIWQRQDTVPLEVLKRIAVQCLTAKLQKTQPEPPFVVLRENNRNHG